MLPETKRQRLERIDVSERSTMRCAVLEYACDPSIGVTGKCGKYRNTHDLRHASQQGSNLGGGGDVTRV